MNVEIWHNPRCSKSRQALALLREKGADPGIRLYLEDGPDEGELRDVLRRLGISANELMRWNEKIRSTLGLHKQSTDDDLIAAMAAHPILIERPIIISDKGGVIGRPPDRVFDIL